MNFMKKSLIFGLFASMLSLGILTSCGGDLDEDLSESLIGCWQGTFVKSVYAADSTTMLVPTDSTTVLRFKYDPSGVVVRGKQGVGDQYEGNSTLSFQWEVKYGKLYFYFVDQPINTLEIWHYNLPVDSVFEGQIEDLKFCLKKL